MQRMHGRQLTSKSACADSAKASWPPRSSEVGLPGTAAFLDDSRVALHKQFSLSPRAFT